MEASGTSAGETRFTSLELVKERPPVRRNYEWLILTLLTAGTLLQFGLLGFGLYVLF